MAKILIAVWPFRAHFFGLMAIAHELRRRGNEVAFYTVYTGERAQSIIEGEGFGFFDFSHPDESLITTLTTPKPPGSWRHPLRLQMVLRNWLLGTLPQQVDDLRIILNEWQPDVLVAETAMWGPFLVLHETEGIPVAVFSTVSSCMLPGPDAPPFGLGLPRPRDAKTRLLAQAARAVNNKLAGGIRRAANEMRVRYGLSPLSVSPTAYAGQMPLYLMPSTPEFDYQRTDLPQSVQYVGPCVYNKPHNEPPPAWLAEVPRDHPWVHVSEGTMHRQAPFVLRAAARGLADRPLQVIMTTGGNRQPDDLNLGPIADNVRVVPWVSHSDLMPLTDVVVTTGGAGTVMTTLNAGVPLIVVPTEWDKAENAQRVVEAGAGLRLPPRRCTPARLRAALEQVLADPSFCENALRLAEGFRKYGGPARAAELVEKLAVAQPSAVPSLV